MNRDDRDLANWSEAGSSTEVTRRTDSDKSSRATVNWTLALLTVPGATIVMLFALGAMMSTDSCNQSRCPRLGGGVNFDMLFYGPPVVALFVLVVSVFTAKRRGGAAVPLAGLALLVADVVILAASVAQV